MSTRRYTFLGPSCQHQKPSFFEEESGRLAYSGRVSALALDPIHPDQIVYVAAATGGLWKTLDNGLHWTPLTDSMRTLASGAVVVDPANPNRIFVGTGEGHYGGNPYRGAGILRTLDGGENFTRTGGLELDDERVTGMAVDRFGQHVFVASTVGVFRSDDHGASWLPVEVPGDPSPNVSHLVLDDSDPSALRLYAGLFGVGVFVSDGSAPFTQLTTGLPVASDGPARIKLALCPAHPEVVYAVFTDQLVYANGSGGSQGRLIGIFRSNNRGATWEKRHSPERPDAPTQPAGDQVLYNLALAVHPVDPDYLLLGMVGLYRSEDGAGSWHGIGDADTETGSVGVHADKHAIVFVPGESDPRKTIVWVGCDGGVFRSADGGSVFAHRNRGLGTMQLLGGAHHPTESTLLFTGSQDNGAQLFEGHPAWREVNGGDAGLTAINPLNPARWYAASPFQLQRSRDYDGTFATLNVGGPGFADFYPVFALAPSRPDIVYFATNQLNFTSGDAEIFQTILEFGTAHASTARISALAVSTDSFGVREVYVGSGRGHFYRVSHTTGVHATVVPAGMQPWNDDSSANITTIAISPRNSLRVYVGIGDLSPGSATVPRQRLFVSNDGGATFTDITDNIPDTVFADGSYVSVMSPINSIVVDPEFTDLDVTKDRVFIGCDVGVFESRDGGATFEARRDGLPNAQVQTLLIDPIGRLLRVVTYGRGAWECSLDFPLVEPPHYADIFVRDHRFDSARALTPLEREHPLKPFDKLRWRSGTDLKVDTELLPGEDADEDEEGDEPKPRGFQPLVSSVAFDGGNIDYLGFRALSHRRPRRGAPSRVYLQVHNRGPDIARSVVARVYWAPMGSDDPLDLPEDFWPAFPDGDAASQVWLPIGPAQTLPVVLRPAEPQVLVWTWNVPSQIPKQIALLAIITSPDDSVFGESTPEGMQRDVKFLARSKKHILLRRTRVNPKAPSTSKWGTILRTAGLVALGAAAVVGVAYAAKQASDEG